jgi:hypothetical protein
MKRRTVLVIGNVPSCHKETIKKWRNESYFSKLNVASLCQPMDQGVLATLKKNISIDFFGDLQRLLKKEGKC